MNKKAEIIIEYLKTYRPVVLQRGLILLEEAGGRVTAVEEKDGRYKCTAPNDSYAYRDVRVWLAINKDGEGTECECAAFREHKMCEHVVSVGTFIIYKEAGLDLFAIATKLMNPLVAGRNGLNAQLSPNEPKWHSFEANPYQLSGTLATFQAPRTNYKRMTPMLENVSTEQGTPYQKFLSKEPESRTSKNYVVYHPEVNYDNYQTFSYRCDCKEPHFMCKHVIAAFQTLLGRDPQYFSKHKDWTKEKNAMLEAQGLTPGEPLAQHITFHVDHTGKLSMRTPSWLWQQDAGLRIRNFRKALKPFNDYLTYRPTLASDTFVDFELGFMFNLSSSRMKIGFELELLKVTYNRKGKASCKRLSMHQAENLPYLHSLDDEFYELLMSISDEGAMRRLINSGFSTGLDFKLTNPWNHVSTEARAWLEKYYIEQLQKLWPYLCNEQEVYALSGSRFSMDNMRKIKLSPSFIHLQFTVEEDNRFIYIRMQYVVEGEVVTEPFHITHNFLFEQKGLFFMLADLKDMVTIRQFSGNLIQLPIANKQVVITNMLPLLTEKYKVTMPDSYKANIVQGEAHPQILLKEYTNGNLLFQPQFRYDDMVVDYSSHPEDIIHMGDDGKLEIMLRDREKEKLVYENLKHLSIYFLYQRMNDFYYLPFKEVMRNNWLFKTIAQLQEEGIPVLGLDELNTFKYNVNKPKWKMRAGNGIDWFDLHIEITFGDQTVSLREVRKAILEKQNVVFLKDGTLGVLPDEWIEQYGLLLKMGEEQKDGTFRLHKLHFSLIDELHDQIEDKQILEEIKIKKERLKNLNQLTAVAPSAEIKANLRPYQLSGFQWMQTLDEMGWGGCLADDMGLGKTLQTITFLQFLKEKYPGSTHLVICPTSLIYNWEAELQKFAPQIRYHIYYGSEREITSSHFEDYDLVITSYGLIRLDLEQLMQFHWHYVILDESQAIKNPEALTTKAVQLLKSKNRLILSGTPVQNNTYDLYAQFQFINPGLLGNRDFYKKQFANAIDKNKDSVRTAELRRLVYPFMLRRNKAQVATDLPDKTEMILWCEMHPEQKAVYMDYKNRYRSTILQKIDEVGVGKAGIYVLEGLLRLRQICDSPQLVKTEEPITNKSIKIDELLREIKENTGEHKLLVFSQFAEMLHLIGESLKEEEIQYAYLDGSTPPTKRQLAINNFQTDPAVKVFLISLKAGGVGLNLTAADYVYIVDPWWNPAMEAQAIDRTHRIGQENKIFAYRMICKDTVEEKIVQLQQRKQQLANELVTEEAGFIKKLSKDDVAFLFS